MVLKKAVSAIFRVGVVCLLPVFWLGCIASFPGKQIPTIDSQHVSAGPTQKAVDYSLTWQVDGKDSSRAVDIFKQDIDEIFQEESIFERYQIGIGKEDVHLDITMNNHGNDPTVSAVISGLTLLIIPAYARDNYTLTVDVSSGGQFIKRYEYNDYIKSWIGWVVAPVAPGNHPREISKMVRGNMVRAFLKDLQTDGIVGK